MISKPERPSKTPEGLDFPYSHFGDPEKRVQLLRDIAKELELNPTVVLNMGCGYDITPSDAFPSARVVHVDREPPDYVPDAMNVVRFLRQSGFEAYTPQELPKGFQADLGISILGPDIEPDIISSDGLVISTNRHPPEGMEVVGIVDGNDSPRIISDRDTIATWMSDNKPFHLLVSQKRQETKS